MCKDGNINDKLQSVLLFTSYLISNNIGNNLTNKINFVNFKENVYDIYLDEFMPNLFFFNISRSFNLENVTQKDLL